MPARDRPDVPVSYLLTVVYFLNRRRIASGLFRGQRPLPRARPMIPWPLMATAIGSRRARPRRARSAVGVVVRVHHLAVPTREDRAQLAVELYASEFLTGVVVDAYVAQSAGLKLLKGRRPALHPAAAPQP